MVKSAALARCRRVSASRSAARSFECSFSITVCFLSNISAENRPRPPHHFGVLYDPAAVARHLRAATLPARGLIGALSSTTSPSCHNTILAPKPARRADLSPWLAKLRCEGRVAEVVAACDQFAPEQHVAAAHDEFKAQITKVPP